MKSIGNASASIVDISRNHALIGSTRGRLEVYISVNVKQRTRTIQHFSKVGGQAFSKIINGNSSIVSGWQFYSGTQFVEHPIGFGQGWPGGTVSAIPFKRIGAIDFCNTKLIRSIGIITIIVFVNKYLGGNQARGITINNIGGYQFKPWQFYLLR